MDSNIERIMIKSNKNNQFYDFANYTNLKEITVNQQLGPIKINSSLSVKTITINCSHGVEITNIPENLEAFCIDTCGIDNVDKYILPMKLKALVCTFNAIKNLNTLPESLITLNCSFNKIKNLDMLPDSLICLICCNNNLTQLQNLPRGLKTLDCSFNELVELNCLPNSLKMLICTNNHINSIILPDTIMYVNAEKNDLNEIPKINKYLYLANYDLSLDVTNSNKIKNFSNKIKWNSYKFAKYTVMGMAFLTFTALSPVIVPFGICYYYYQDKKHHLEL
jgi:hypothetical protein